MSTPEQRLEEMGLAVPEVAKPVASYVPAVRSGNHVFTSGQLPMRDGPADHHRQGRRRGHRRGGRRVRPPVRAQRAGRGARGDRRAVERSSGSSRSSRSWRRPRTSPASPASPTAPRELFGEVFGDDRPARPQRGRRPGAAPRRSRRGRADRRGLGRPWTRRAGCPPTSSSTPAPSPTAAASRSTPEHASTVVLLRDGDGQPGGLEVYLLRRHVDMAFAAGMCVFPGRRRRQARLRRRHRLGRARPPAEWASAARHATRRSRGRWCAPRCARRSRSPACCSPAPTEDSVVADTTGDGLGGGPPRARGPRGLASPTFLDRRGLKLRTDLLRLWGSWVTPVFEPRRFNARFFVAELPDRPGHPRRVDRVRRGGVAAAARGDPRRSTTHEMLMLPPTYCTLPGDVRPTRTPADVLAAADGPRPDPGRAAGRASTTTAPTCPSPTGWSALGEDVAARLRHDRWPAGRSASARAACSRRTRTS